MREARIQADLGCDATSKQADVSVDITDGPALIFDLGSRKLRGTPVCSRNSRSHEI